MYLSMFVFQFILHIVKIWGTNTFLYPFTNGDTISIIMPILKNFIFWGGRYVVCLWCKKAHMHTELRYGKTVWFLCFSYTELWQRFMRQFSLPYFYLNESFYKCLAKGNPGLCKWWDVDLDRLVVMQNNWFLFLFLFYLEVLLNLLYCFLCGLIISIPFENVLTRIHR